MEGIDIDKAISNIKLHLSCRHVNNTTLTKGTSFTMVLNILRKTVNKRSIQNEKKVSLTCFSKCGYGKVN